MRQWRFLIILGSWSLSTFVLMNFYTTLLISDVTAPEPKPLIRSIRDLVDRDDVHLVTDKQAITKAHFLVFLSSNRHAIFQTIPKPSFIKSAESGLLKSLGNKLKAFPGSLCNTSKECVEMVKSGKAVYAGAVTAFLLPAMKEDFSVTKQCDFELGRAFAVLPVRWAIQKNSSYEDFINKG